MVACLRREKNSIPVFLVDHDKSRYDYDAYFDRYTNVKRLELVKTNVDKDNNDR